MWLVNDEEMMFLIGPRKGMPRETKLLIGQEWREDVLIGPRRGNKASDWSAMKRRGFLLVLAKKCLEKQSLWLVQGTEYGYLERRTMPLESRKSALSCDLSTLTATGEAEIHVYFESSVAHPGCLSRIRIYPSQILGQKGTGSQICIRKKEFKCF